jgi:hypothetical protein
MANMALYVERHKYIYCIGLRHPERNLAAGLINANKAENAGCEMSAVAESALICTTESVVLQHFP